jgi:peptidoglycan hydrolase CwlO-like protein
VETRSVIVLATWICTTILSAMIIWVSQQLELWNSIFILLLLSIAFTVTYAIPFGLPGVDSATKQPTKQMQEQLTNISKQLQELNQKVDYIKKQLEE